METIVVALICTTIFGTVMVIAAFVRQILLSRDKRLNDEANARAMDQEAAKFEKMREEMRNNQRFEAHYSMLGANKEAIKIIDSKIEEILNRKGILVDRYSEIAMKESAEIIKNGGISVERKSALDKTRANLESTLKSYDTELAHLQKQRSALWDTHLDFERYLLSQEKARNASLDALYKQHSALLEKLYLRHIDNTENVATESIRAGTSSFKDMLLAPIQFLMHFFSGGAAVVMPNVAFVHTRVEREAREDVRHTQDDLNESPDEAPAPRRKAKSKGATYQHPKEKPAPRKSSYTSSNDEEIDTESMSFGF